MTGFKIIVGYDATHDNVRFLPKGLAAGYTTGSPDVEWTPTDWANHPGALRICQDSGATDNTADILDVESGAATFADCPGWSRRALTSYNDAARPGQRKPSIYASASNIPSVANALVNDGVDGGVGLFVANWNLSEAQAVQVVQDAAGPFPIIGLQYKDAGNYDCDIFEWEWAHDVSRAHQPGFPRRHISAGHDSFLEFCKQYGFEPQEVMHETFLHEEKGFGVHWRTYINKGDFERRMPVGTVIWTPA